eukprot:s388_g14.t1
MQAKLDSADDFDRLVEALDEKLRLRRDIQAPDGRWRLRRGQQLLREAHAPSMPMLCSNPTTRVCQDMGLEIGR